MPHSSLPVALAAVALLASSPAPAHAAPRKAAARKPAEVTKLEPGPDTMGLLIWGGGRKPGDGEAAMASWNASDLQSSDEAVPFESNGVKGLKPGFHLVVLGACPQEKAQAVFAVVHENHPDAYLRWVPRAAVEKLRCPEVALPPDPCASPEGAPAVGAAPPAHKGGATGKATARDDDEWEDHSEPELSRMSRSRERTISRGACTLVLKLDERSESDGEFEEVANWSAVVELRKGKELLETMNLGKPEWGRVQTLEVVGDGIRVDARELDSHCSGSLEFYEGADVRRVLRIGRGKIVVEEERDGLFGVCPPAGEGADGSCWFSCASDRYTAMDAVCKTPDDRQTCESEEKRKEWEEQEQRCLAECKETENKTW